MVVRAESRMSGAPAHREIGPKSRMIELLAELSAVLEIRIDQERAQIVCTGALRLHANDRAASQAAAAQRAAVLGFTGARASPVPP